MTGTFLSFGPLIKGAFLGAAKCMLWGGLTGPYAIEVACYQDNVLKEIQVVAPNTVMQGTFITSDGGSIGWTVDLSGKFYHMGIQPFNDTASVLDGQFP
jgi:hypothetical protein